MLGAGTSGAAAPPALALRRLPAAGRPRGDLYLKRQPPMGRSIDQLRWQHRLTNHLADRGVPAARALGLVEQDGLWYELHEPAAGRDDVYAGADTWDPFAARRPRCRGRRDAGAAARSRRRTSRPLVPQPQAGFVVQLGLAGLAPSRRSRSSPAAPGGRRVPARPGLAGAGRGRLRPVCDARRRAGSRGLPRAAAARRLADQQPVLRGRPAERRHRLPPGGLRAAASRPGGRGRAQLLLLERISAGDDGHTTCARRRSWSPPTTPSRR